jgi:hypothetical protein
MEPYKRYLVEIESNLRYSANWLPSDPLNLGDVGYIEDGRFKRITSLTKMGISYEQILGKPLSQIRYSSSEGVVVQGKAAGKSPITGSALTKQEAGIEIFFKKGASVFFEAQGGIREMMGELNVLGSEILKLFHAAKWEKDFVVITEIYRTNNTTIIIGTGEEAKVVLTSSADIPAGPLELASLDAKLSVKHHSQVSFQAYAENEIASLYRYNKIQNKGLFGMQGHTFALDDPREVENSEDDWVFEQLPFSS